MYRNYTKGRQFSEYELGNNSAYRPHLGQRRKKRRSFELKTSEKLKIIRCVLVELMSHKDVAIEFGVKPILVSVLVRKA